MNLPKNKVQFLGLFIWFLAAIFFFYEFFLRVFVATISNTIMSQLDLNAQKFAIIGAGYYLAYSFMQIPIGILADRFGVRYLLTLFIIFCAIGAMWFSLAQGFFPAFISRAFMGFGSSAAYVSLLIIALNWFPKKHFGFMVGLSNFLGAIGPILAGGPLALLLEAFDNDWRMILKTVGIAGFILAVVVFFFIRTSPGRNKGQIIYLDPYKETLFQKLKVLLKNSQVWFVIIYSGFVYVTLPLLGAYWGTAYLIAKGLTRAQAASVSSLLWIGLAVGSLLSGRVSDYFKRRNPILNTCSFIGILASLAILYWPGNEIFLYCFFFFCIGIASSGQAVAVATISEKVPKKLQGTSFGMNNMFVMLFAGIIPPIISHFIGRASGEEVARTGYTASNFLEGLIYMPLFYGAAFFISLFFIDETFNRHQLEIIKPPKRTFHDSKKTYKINAFPR